MSLRYFLFHFLLHNVKSHITTQQILLDLNSACLVSRYKFEWAPAIFAKATLLELQQNHGAAMIWPNSPSTNHTLVAHP
jgi:hypothetical protein